MPRSCRLLLGRGRINRDHVVRFTVTMLPAHASWNCRAPRKIHDGRGRIRPRYRFGPRNLRRGTGIDLTRAIVDAEIACARAERRAE